VTVQVAAVLPFCANIYVVLCIKAIIICN